MTPPLDHDELDTGAQPVTITVNAVNDAPTLTLTGTAAFVQNAGATVGSVVATYTTTDEEGGLVSVTLSDATNYVLGTGDQAGMVLLSATGLAKVNAGQSLPSFTLRPNDGMANGTAVTNTAAETVMASFAIPAGALKQGRIIDYFAAAIATATNGTDTFRYRVRLGGLTGSVVADSGAIDLANNDALVVQGQVVVREDGASGSIVGAAQGVLKTTAFNTLLDAAATDTTAALTLVLTCQQSAASAGNSARATALYCASVMWCGSRPDSTAHTSS